MLNYRVEPSVLNALVPAGTELDRWEGMTYISVVGFLFANTRILGVPIPFHRTFEEVNLRFYVRRSVGGEVRRGVTFIKELVPRAAIATVARIAYNEPYTSLPMNHVYGEVGESGVPDSVEYGWRFARTWAGMRAAPCGTGTAARSASEEEFITEHYWGYTRQRDGSTIEYRVEHPSWRVWSVQNEVLTGELAPLYGTDLARILARPAASAFLADGSAVTVFSPTRLTHA